MLIQLLAEQCMFPVDIHFDAVGFSVFGVLFHRPKIGPGIIADSVLLRQGSKKTCSALLLIHEDLSSTTKEVAARFLHCTKKEKKKKKKKRT